jgi:hypothetical protein
MKPFRCVLDNVVVYTEWSKVWQSEKGARLNFLIGQTSHSNISNWFVTTSQLEVNSVSLGRVLIV